MKTWLQWFVLPLALLSIGFASAQEKKPEVPIAAPAKLAPTCTESHAPSCPVEPEVTKAYDLYMSLDSVITEKMRAAGLIPLIEQREQAANLITGKIQSHPGYQYVPGNPNATPPAPAQYTLIPQPPPAAEQKDKK